jgi:hypothetical protein
VIRPSAFWFINQSEWISNNIQNTLHLRRELVDVSLKTNVEQTFLRCSSIRTFYSYDVKPRQKYIDFSIRLRLNKIRLNFLDAEGSSCKTCVLLVNFQYIISNDFEHDSLRTHLIISASTVESTSLKVSSTLTLT